MAGVSSTLPDDSEIDEEGGERRGHQVDVARKVFKQVVKLGVGEALLFAPSAIVGLETAEDGSRGLKRLGAGFLKIKVRSRLTTDGGKSVMAG